MTPAPDVVVIGAGPSGLIAAETLGAAGLGVMVCDRMPSVARKLLMAGRGGLNLTHSEPLDSFLDRYGSARARLAPHIEAFPPEALRAWAGGLGQTTFVGPSGRVFPEAMKASPLLRAWLARLADLGVDLRTRWNWRGWDEHGALAFDTPDGRKTVRPAAVLLALGGASWPRLGSDGGWAGVLGAAGATVAPFRPANCGFDVAWTAPFTARFHGEPLKNVALSFGGRRARGDLVISRYGLEGGALYALSAPLRDAIEGSGRAVLGVDLRPDLTLEHIQRRLEQPRGGRSLSNHLRRSLKLAPVAANLIREAAGAALPTDAAALAGFIKHAPITLVGVQPLARAISSAGGVAWTEVGPDLQLKALPGVYVAGEMLDWEAPTGGYLLQACFASGVAAAKAVLAARDG